MRPKKKRRCVNANSEDDRAPKCSTRPMNNTSNEKKIERRRKNTVSFGETNKRPSFSIKYSEGSKSTKAKLQPYQLSKKKSGNRTKKPKKPK